jgi:UDP-N-acetylglucosamine 2-epimerase (non-hydrolysing)
MPAPLKTMIVMGTRPEVVKLAPVALELRRYPKQFRVTLVGTGQHRELVPQHLKLFRLRLDADLKVMKPRQTLADVTARTIQRLDALLASDPPDVVVVEGDTTAVLAAGLAAFYRKIPVAHVEAGLRSGDVYNPFPEEINRRLVGGRRSTSPQRAARAGICCARTCRRTTSSSPAIPLSTHCSSLPNGAQRGRRSRPRHSRGGA